MEPSKKRKDVDEDRESSRLERDDDEQEIDQDSHSELSPSKVKKCSSKPSLSTSVVDRSSASSFHHPPGGNHGAQERDQRHSDQVVEASRYYTRSAARKLPPQPPSQLRAGKLLIQNVDRGIRHAQVYKNTLMRQTATSRVTPAVRPDAQPNVSGIVPLGPPPARDDPNWFKPRMITKFSEWSGTGSESFQNSQAAEVAGRFDHIPPPSLPYDDALELLVAFNERVKNLKDGSDRREQFLALEKDLGFPESAGLFWLYQISGSVFINYLMDYFKWWESRKANVPESSQTEGHVSPEKEGFARTEEDE